MVKYDCLKNESKENFSNGNCYENFKKLIMFNKKINDNKNFDSNLKRMIIKSSSPIELLKYLEEKK